jgi:hypothetical protein
MNAAGATKVINAKATRSAATGGSSSAMKPKIPSGNSAATITWGRYWPK